MVACGDDSGSDEDGNSDGDQGKQDGGSQSDASQTIDASQTSNLTLADALKTDGVNTSLERAMLIFPVACEKRQACVKDSTCVDGFLGAFNRLVEEGSSAACIDAKLDLFACLASGSDCHDFTACMPLSTTSKALCDGTDAGT